MAPVPEPGSDEVPVAPVEPDEPLGLVEPLEPVLPLVPLPVPEPLFVLFVVGVVPLEPLVPLPVPVDELLDGCDVLADELPVPVGSEPVEPVSESPVVGVVLWFVAVLDALLSSVAVTDAPASVITPEAVLDELEEFADGVERCVDASAECCFSRSALVVCDADFACVCATSETLTAAAASWSVVVAGDAIGPA